MIDPDRIELFMLKCPVIEGELRRQLIEHNRGATLVKISDIDTGLDQYIKQFDLSIRNNASKMAQYYEIFYMLENDIRQLIADTLEAAHGPNWWDLRVPQGPKDEAKKNREREEQAGVTARSEDEIDYITFGQLQEIIRSNWDDFAGIMSNQSAVIRVLSGLNMLRGTIAHCGTLAEDEVERLKLAIKDWFRVLEGPKN